MPRMAATNSNPTRIRDTGVRVHDVLRELAKDVDVAAVLSKFPEITSEDLRASLEFAAEATESVAAQQADRDWSPELAAIVRDQLQAFAEDWDDPQMDVYDVHFAG